MSASHVWPEGPLGGLGGCFSVELGTANQWSEANQDPKTDNHPSTSLQETNNFLNPLSKEPCFPSLESLLLLFSEFYPIFLHPCTAGLP